MAAILCVAYYEDLENGGSLSTICDRIEIAGKIIPSLTRSSQDVPLGVIHSPAGR
jgi:hypothetical protein